MKKSTKLVSAVVVLAVLGGVYVGLNTYVSKEEKAESSSEEESKTEVFSVKTDDIKSLEFIVDKKEVTFEKKDDSWVKKDETAFPVNQTTLDSAASAIETVEADRVLEDVENLAEYGLDSPSNTVIVDTADGTTKLNIGDENTSTNQYYISRDDDDSTVYVVAADTVSPFMNSLYDYAQGEDFPTIDSSTVKKVQVSEDKDSYVLEENSDGATWNVSSDGSSDKESADTTAAGNVTSGLGSFAFDQFVNYNAEDLSQYGLDKPYATITVDYQEEVKNDSTDSTESGENDSTASESDSESSDTTDTDSSSEDADSKTTTVDKQLVIYVGDEAGDGSRYVTVDNKQIYTMSTDTLSAVIDKTPSDLWSLIVNYLSVKNLDQLQVTYGETTNTVNVSRETSTDDDGNEKETTTYQLDGEEIESTTFTTFYNKLINMAGQKRLTEAYTPAADPEMSAVFTDSDKNQTTVTFYTYDTNYYAAVVGDKVFLVNKMTVKEMFNAYETMVNGETETEATATPTAEAEK
ncbi:DUF4340 domain-containing protein [Blautia massiliensis]|uniref:DUF4340 domain-containing protein n=1 Tax=Blautia TaxID=572511 RepID=UPI00156D8488|nr:MULTISPECIES: DUF4340 domain-containing protein [Blautia]MCC2726450.1 DUF4340 domain-containing protein [Blautia sp. MSK22_86]NSF58136.1 DUF4340 domain-containing protein [Blautia massiliensis (ex Durand et al. 2017)]NSK73554.1 DUF4340 domain-containing protein [Blautia massiliensis (ex Durand et al. 2017)]